MEINRKEKTMNLKSTILVSLVALAASLSISYAAEDSVSLMLQKAQITGQIRF